MFWWLVLSACFGALAVALGIYTAYHDDMKKQKTPLENNGFANNIETNTDK